MEKNPPFNHEHIFIYGFLFLLGILYLPHNMINVGGIILKTILIAWSSRSRAFSLMNFIVITRSRLWIWLSLISGEGRIHLKLLCSPSSFFRTRSLLDITYLRGGSTWARRMSLIPHVRELLSRLPFF